MGDKDLHVFVLCFDSYILAFLHLGLKGNIGL